jgi:hypothetical protein
MTRDEAKSKLMAETANHCTERFMEDFLDSAVALGMLILTEPQCVSERAVDAMFCHPGSLGGMITPRGALAALEAAGLKIVEVGAR